MNDTHPNDTQPNDVQRGLVSVVIPTRRRPLLVQRAIASVLNQTYAQLEVLVIIDGPDAETEQALRQLTDPRLHVLTNPVSIGPGPARNRAAETARGEWIAFLDDDDEFLPQRLERQLAGRSSDQAVLVSCRCRVETPRAVYTWPHRVYHPGEPVDEYLFGRRNFTRGEAFLPPASYLLPAWLFRRTGFGDTSQNEDTTFLLRVTKQQGGEIQMLPDVLAVIHAEEARESAGYLFDWRACKNWIDSMGDLITPRAYSGYCLVVLGSQAALHGDYAAAPLLLRAAWRRGAPTSLQLALFAVFWIIPSDLRRRFRAALARLRG